MNHPGSSRDSGKAGDGKPSRAFSRERRLLKAAEFGRVFARPLKSSDRYFTVFARPPATLETGSRLGLAIAKKQLRRAVDRNRIKRLLREYFRTRVFPRADIPLDFVVMARSAVREASAEVLRDSLDAHLRRLHRLASNDTDSRSP